MGARTLETEVLVVGAGASGIPAAIGAARAGAKVILIEEDPIVGGATTDFCVDMLCGGPRTGIIREAESLLGARHSLLKEGGGRFFLPSSFLRVFSELLQKEKKLDVITGARATEAMVRRGAERPRVAGVRVGGGPTSGLTIRSKVTIDATGTGAVAILAGCRVMYGRDAKTDFGEEHAPAKRDAQVQQCTWMYLSQQLGSGKPLDMTELENVELGVLVNGVGWFHHNPEKALRAKPRLYLHWGCAVECKDTRDPLAVGRAQVEALGAMERDHALLREHHYAVYLAPRIGVRESSRVVGEHVVTEGDLRSGVLPEDTIAVGTYGLDIWGGNLSRDECRTPGYGIPYRSIVPADVDGLLLAGKAISGTHIAMSAYRVMPIVGSIGQAAGVAAALCVRNRVQPRTLDPRSVRRILKGRKQNLKLTLD